MSRSLRHILAEEGLTKEAASDGLSDEEKAWAKKVAQVLESAAEEKARLDRLMKSAPASMEPERMNLAFQDTPGHTLYWEATSAQALLGRVGFAAKKFSRSSH